jgi:tRNA threonylcarbamoyladenosine biosynthesis protein TsaE
MPILAPHALEFFSHSPEQTRRVGIRLGSLLQPGMVICLEGNLGSGKTTLVQGLAQGWGSTDQVSSPTYVILNEYRHPTGNHFYHADAYRLEQDSKLDLAILDFDHLLEHGILVIEWAEKLKKHLPHEHLWIQMGWVSLEQRHLILTPRGKTYEAVLKKLQQALFGAF